MKTKYKSPQKRAAKIPVSERALIARINRKLAQDDEGEELRKSRSEYMKREWGTYYIVNTRLNIIKGWKLFDLEELAKEYDALKPYECLAEP
jgi:hypothetical protein